MLQFDEETHTYSVNGKVLKSVTETIELFFPFDKERVAEITASKTGFTKEYVLQHWDDKSNIACSKGNHYHQMAEDYFNGKPILDDPYSSQIKQFFEDHMFLDKYKAEWQVWSEKLGVAGTIDLVMNEKGNLYIFDWKTSKEIKMDSYWKGIGPANKLMDCSFVKYSLQLSLYRYILEKHYKLPVAFTGVIHLNKSGKYTLLQTMYLKKEIKEMLKHPLFTKRL